MLNHLILTHLNVDSALDDDIYKERSGYFYFIFGTSFRYRLMSSFIYSTELNVYYFVLEHKHFPLFQFISFALHYARHFAAPPSFIPDSNSIRSLVIASTQSSSSSSYLFLLLSRLLFPYCVFVCC